MAGSSPGESYIAREGERGDVEKVGRQDCGRGHGPRSPSGIMTGAEETARAQYQCPSGHGVLRYRKWIQLLPGVRRCEKGRSQDSSKTEQDDLVPMGRRLDRLALPKTKVGVDLRQDQHEES